MRKRRRFLPDDPTDLEELCNTTTSVNGIFHRIGSSSPVKITLLYARLHTLHLG